MKLHKTVLGKVNNGRWDERVMVHLEGATFFTLDEITDPPRSELVWDVFDLNCGVDNYSDKRFVLVTRE